MWGVADKKQKTRYVDNGWPASDGEDDHAISELAADRTGALSPFGELTFPLPADEICRTRTRSPSSTDNGGRPTSQGPAVAPR